MIKIIEKSRKFTVLRGELSNLLVVTLLNCGVNFKYVPVHTKEKNMSTFEEK
jgi:hypothetical protein